MICQRMGLPPMSMSGFGIAAVSSDSRVPNPPAKITAFILRAPSPQRAGRSLLAKPLEAPEETLRGIIVVPEKAHFVGFCALAERDGVRRVVHPLAAVREPL